MSSQPRVLGVIPARAGSKRIPNKNLRSLCGKPLLAWTIEACSQAESLTSFVVTTEDQSIAQVANLYGAYVVKRPEELATDGATSGSVCKHALEWMGKDDYDLVCLLHPTSPIRNSKHIDEAVDLLWNSGSPALASVECVKRCYIHNASIYVVRTEYISDREPWELNCIPYLMDQRHSIDINTEEDWHAAEVWIKQEGRLLEHQNGDGRRETSKAGGSDSLEQSWQVQ